MKNIRVVPLRRIVLLLLLLGAPAVLLCALLYRPRPALAFAAPAPTPNYILSEAALYALAQKNDTAALRAHAWNLLSSQLQPSATPDAQGLVSGANQVSQHDPGEQPAWESLPWLGKCDVGIGSTSCKKPPAARASSRNLAGTLEIPAQIAAAKPTAALTAPAFHLSSSLFNPAAKAFVTENKLADSGTWKAAPASGPALPSPLKPESLIVKEIWEYVSACDPGKSCPQTIHTWDRQSAGFPSTGPHAATVLPPIDSWPNASTIDANPAIPCKLGDYPPPNTGTAANPIPIRCFHFLKFPANTLTTNLRADIQQYIPNTPAFIILVGFHVMSGETRNWVWSTFWWTGQPTQDAKANDKPQSLKQLGGPWNFYAMDTFVSASNPGPTLAGNPHDNILFNPYLEGPTPGGPVSNCLYCHSHAVYRANKKTWVLDDLNALHIPPQAPPGASYFSAAVQTHFLWGIASHLDQPLNGSGSVTNFRLGTEVRGKGKTSASPSSAKK